ncbi:hypothetical protein DFH09DRAFT_1318866 [Mycena vulgaris]|nr:hypothetical protein DFH09DRAFT_1318866 [Mycena vulgaris]
MEPVADASPQDADVQSSADVDVEERELEEDSLLLSVSFKEWQARKLERAKEVEVAQEREREREREHDKDAAQGEDKENEAVLAKAEDDLTRILDGLRRSADVEMADAVPLAVAPAVAPFVTLDELQPKAKVVPLSMTAFVAAGNEHLSPRGV